MKSRPAPAGWRRARTTGRGGNGAKQEAVLTLVNGEQECPRMSIGDFCHSLARCMVRCSTSEHRLPRG
jgi:hypothetical protein